MRSRLKLYNICVKLFNSCRFIANYDKDFDQMRVDNSINMRVFENFYSNEHFELGLLHGKICHIQEGFNSACINGHFDIVKRLYYLSNGRLDVYSPFVKVCKNGHLEIAKWLYNNSYASSYRFGPDNFNNLTLRIAFDNACICGHLETAKWLHGLASGASLQDSHLAYANIFMYLCTIQLVK